MAAPIERFRIVSILKQFHKIKHSHRIQASGCEQINSLNFKSVKKSSLSWRNEVSWQKVQNLKSFVVSSENGPPCRRDFGGGIRHSLALFSTSSQLSSRRYSSHQENTGNDSLAIGIGLFGLCSAGLFYSFWQKDSQETIEKMIARAIIAERENRLGDADRFYHQATVMCEKEKNNQALVYTYDQMANFNMRHGRLEKAENLFKETIKLLLISGIQREDPAVVEISLKLSRIYERTGRNSEADVGFKWCIETSEKLIKDMSDDSTEESQNKIMNLKSLLGMCLEEYARFLGSTNMLAESENLYKRALDICESDLTVSGKPHPQFVVLLNDLGTICDMRGHRDEALVHVERAVHLAERSSPEMLLTILCNLASIKMHKGLNDEAREIYKRALVLAKKQGDQEATIIIRANLPKVL